MRRELLTLSILALFAAPLCADEPMSKSEAEARAAIALAKAKAKMPTVAAQTRSVPYDAARKIAVKEGKPIFVSVRLNCADLCKALRPDFVTCHEQSFENSEAPRALLLLPDGAGNLWRVKTWAQMPSALQVRVAAAEAKKTTAEPADPSLDVLMMELVAGMIAVEPGFEYTQAAPVGYGWQCDGYGHCRQVPLTGALSTAAAYAQGYATLPVAGGPVSAAPPQQDFAGGGEGFVARFPRLAKFRGRVRGAIGLPPPHVAGGFVSFPAPAAAVPMQTMQPPAATALATPAATSGPATSFVHIGPHRVDGGLIDRARAAGIPWASIFEAVLKYGPEVLEMILKIINGK